MRAGVITIPRRLAALQRLLDVVEPEVEAVEIFIDKEHRGHTWNYGRMFQAMLDKALIDEPILLMTDDAITIPGWRDRWLRIHQDADSDLYTLFGRQRHLFKDENLRRGYITKVQARGWYDQGAIFINQQRLPEMVQRWFESGGREYMNAKRAKSSNHFDLVVQEYFVYHNIPWTITTPSLFDHHEVASTLGHSSIGGSPAYIGHENI